jgi:NitT/TauT family transport system substrate-binding protein
VFSSGPEAVEALLAGDLDACYLGPMPALAGFVRSHGEALAVIRGAASGGAALVVRPAAGVAGPSDLHGKRLAAPQLGNTQDVSLRTYLRANGLTPRERGGDVAVFPLAAADAFLLMKRGELDGAWLPEPWPSRLHDELSAHTLTDDTALWGPGTPTALVAVSRALVAAHPELVRALAAAHDETLAWMSQHPDEAVDALGGQLAALTGKRLPRSLVERAYRATHFSAAIDPEALARFATAASALGYLPAKPIDHLLEAPEGAL